MPNIKLMPDYYCYPLWWNDGVRFGDIDPAALPISAQLAADLIAWSAAFDAIYDDNDPAASAFASPAAEAAFDQRGHQLWRLLQNELGAAYAVAYFSISSRKLNRPE